MKLKKLGLQGYKTFASRTNFEFDEGITAIVGPNGSGKSNIADAIRWVLGEQSYSMLRGKRTTDMIFAGSQQRSRAGMAQAILTLDNSDGWLPIDYTEIEIGRRAHRSGDNEYLLNGHKVRLRDITDLLAKSGLAQRTYTVIGQGLVDQALSLRADERRMLFEEAAGVSHYKQRRAETLRRLEETTHNLERVQDIIAEIRPRLSTLRRQASRAQNYEQVAADLRHLLQIWYGFRWEENKEELRKARFESETSRAAWVETRDKQLQLQETLDWDRRALNRLQEESAALESEREQIRERLENARRVVAVLSERQSLLKRQLDEHAEELPALEAQRKSAAEQLEKAMVELKLAQEEMDAQHAELRSFEAGFLTQQVEIERWQENLASLRQEKSKVTDALSQSKGRVAQLVSQLRERLSDAGDEPDLSGLTEEIKSYEARVEDEQQNLTEIQHRQLVQEQKRQAIQKELEEARSRKDQLAAELAELKQEMAGVTTRLEILERTEANERAVPTEVANLGQLADIPDVPERYQGAIRAALGRHFLAWILRDEQAIWKLHELPVESRIAAIVENSGLDAGFERPTLPSNEHIIGWADQLITANTDHIELARRVLNRILIVSDARVAYKIADSMPPGSIAVSVDGFVAHSGGLIELGAGQLDAAEQARKAERKKAKDSLAELESTQTELVANLVEIDDQVKMLQASHDQQNAILEDLKKEERNTAASLNKAQATQNLALQRLEFQRTEARRNRDYIERLEARISEQKSTIQEYEISVSRLDLSLEEGQRRLAQLPVSESTETRKQLEQGVESARTILAGRQAVIDSRQATLNQVADQLRRRSARYQELQKRWAASELTVKETELAALQKEMTSLRQKLQPLRKQLADRQRKLAQLEQELSGLQRTSHEAETRYTQARIDLTQHESKIENLKERIQADLGLVALTYDDDEPIQSPLPIAEIVETLPVVDSLPDDIEESIRRYRGQLNRIGAINPEAPAEYNELLNRYEFLVRQTEDLSATEQRLREVIADLDDLTSRAFAETVEKVDDVFGEVFRRLFGGGSAQLALTDPDDLTITGVDIVARLPRRREQGLALLSGGERSLTAAALIFALLKVSPTPFCVLDEVDAMLDEANINRFREVLAELSQRTQFIVITHNRGTVQVAESVYGVSMGADSVSQVISIKPEDYIRQHSR